MNEIILNILSVIITAIVLPLITFAGAKLTAWLNTKIKSEKAQEAISNGVNAVALAVAETMQTYVDTLKTNGEFTQEAQKTAYKTAKDKALQLITADVKNAIEANYGDFTAWLQAQIESKVNELKGGNK